MASVLLAIDIILAIGLTILVLLQRSEGGALGALGGGGGNSMFTGRQTGNMLTRLTWWFFALFVIVNLALVVIAKKSTVEEPVSILPTEQSAPLAPQPASAPTAAKGLPAGASVRLAMADKAPVIEYEAPTATSEAQIDLVEQKPSMDVQIEAPALPEVPTVQGGDPTIDAGAFPADE